LVQLSTSLTVYKVSVFIYGTRFKTLTIVTTKANAIHPVTMATQAHLQAILAALMAANNAQAAQTQAATAALTASAAAPPLVSAPPAFTLLTGSSEVNPLTFKTSEDIKIYNAATKGLDKKFDLKKDNLPLFLSEVKERFRTFGWTNIITVPESSVPLLLEIF
jgi:hypothetical protein